MAGMTWNDSLSVGVKLIDEQHQTLIDRQNAVAAAVAAHEGAREIVRTLGFLIDYVDTHFRTEEGLMSSSQYPDLDAHKALHEEFRRTLADLKRDFNEEGATVELADALNALLSNWLVNHIRAVDTTFARTLRS